MPHHQVTPWNRIRQGAKTSDHGWDTYKKSRISCKYNRQTKSKGIRTSIFIDADPIMVAGV